MALFEFHFHVTDKSNDEILDVLNIIKNQNKKIMATLTDFQTALSVIDTKTTESATAVLAIQARIDAYIAAVNAGGMTAQEEAGALALLAGTKANSEALAASLTAMAVDPENPAPVEVPTPLQ